MGLSAQHLPLPETGPLGQVLLGEFLDELPGGLQVLSEADTAAAARARPVRWVEPSELEDPTPYLLDGEFILTAGLPFVGAGGTAAALDRYVARLVQAKVCALGFGLKPYFEQVPPELAEACRRHGLMLLQIPHSVPFAALGLQFARLLEARNLRALRRVSEATRQLLRAALSARPDAQVLDTLVRQLPVRALLAGADGRVRIRAAAGQGAGPDAGRLAALLEKLFAGAGPRIELDSFDDPGFGAVMAYPLRSTRDATVGAVVIGADSPLGPVERNIAEIAVGLLEAQARQRTSGALAPGQLATSLLLHPETSTAGASRQSNAARDLLAQCTGSVRSGALRVVQGLRAGSGAAARPAAEGAARELLQWRRLFDTKLVELTDYGFCAVTRLKVDDAVVAKAEELGWLLAVSEPGELSGLPEAYRTATSLRRQVQTSGKSVRAEGTDWSVAGLLGREAGRMLAGRLLGPLLELEPGKAAPLLRVLRGWLAENGSWDAAAKALGLHRNSVRRQIGQAAELLGLDLAAAGTRAELLIALQFVEPQRTPAAGEAHDG